MMVKVISVDMKSDTMNVVFVAISQKKISSSKKYQYILKIYKHA